MLVSLIGFAFVMPMPRPCPAASYRNSLYSRPGPSRKSRICAQSLLQAR